MKKILVAVMAVMMTMGLMAQCPKDKSKCSANGAVGCQIKKECVYSPETRAMMKVDRIALVVKDLTEVERKSLVDFYVAHFFKVEKRKELANPMTREECIKECNAELRRVLGDERYIQYLEILFSVLLKFVNTNYQNHHTHLSKTYRWDFFLFL